MSFYSLLDVNVYHRYSFQLLFSLSQKAMAIFFWDHYGAYIGSCVRRKVDS